MPGLHSLLIQAHAKRLPRGGFVQIPLSHVTTRYGITCDNACYRQLPVCFRIHLV
jgi:hypothetical protein